MHKSHPSNLILPVSLFLTLLTGCHDMSPAARIARVENGLQVPRSMAVDRRPITQRMAYYHVPGLSLAVIDNGQIVWAKGYGTLEPGGTQAVDTHTLFHGASLSKVVNAMTVLKLVGDGKLNLDEEVGPKLISWHWESGPYDREKQITLRSILSHTAGFNVPFWGIGSSAAGPVPTLAQALGGKLPATNPAVAITYPPGQRYHYSGGGVAVSQQLLVDVTHEPYEKLVQKTVFDPLEMTDSTFEQTLPPDWASRAAPGFAKDGKRLNGIERVYPAMSAAGIWTTPTDMAKVVLEIQRTANNQPGRVLQPAQTREMLTGIAEYPRTAIPAKAALGLFVAGEGDGASFFHAGSHAGYRAYLVGTVHTGKGLVIMTNGDTTFDLIGEVVEAVSREYGWKDFTFVPPPQSATTQPAGRGASN